MNPQHRRPSEAEIFEELDKIQHRAFRPVHGRDRGSFDYLSTIPTHRRIVSIEEQADGSLKVRYLQFSSVR